MSQSDEDKITEEEKRRCRGEKANERRRVILPDKQRQRQDVCLAEEMLRKKMKSSACILGNIRSAVISV